VNDTLKETGASMSPEQIQRMFEEMGLGTEEERAAYRYVAPPDSRLSVAEPTEMIFIRTDSVSAVLDPLTQHADLAQPPQRNPDTW
jgi:hypothetical protein